MRLLCNVHAQLLPGRPAHLVASAPHSSGLSAGSAWCSGYQTRSELNIRAYNIYLLIRKIQWAREVYAARKVYAATLV